MSGSKTVLNIAVTGGVGSGKSTVCGLFRSWGYPVYNADLICREALPSVSRLLLSRWGGGIVKKNGGAGSNNGGAANDSNGGVAINSNAGGAGSNNGGGVFRGVADFKQKESVGGVASVEPVELDRQKIAEIVFNDPEELRFLNSIMHRIAKEKIAEICAGKLDSGKDRLRFVEVPLLYETGMEKNFDFTVCVWSPECRTPNFEARAAFQLSPLEKLERSDFAIINTSAKDFLSEQCQTLLEHLKNTANNTIMR